MSLFHTNRHQLKVYDVKLAREGLENQEGVKEEASVFAAPGKQLESSQPPSQLPHTDSHGSLTGSHGLQKGSRTSLPEEASPPSKTSSKSSLHAKFEVPSEQSSHVTSSFIGEDEGMTNKKQDVEVAQDGWPQPAVEPPKTYLVKEKIVVSKAPEEQAPQRKAEVRMERAV